MTLYSFEEVIGFLNGSMPQLDLDELEEWVRTTMNDTELADRIKEQNEKDTADVKKMEGVRGLMEVRLEQCKRLV